MSAHLITPQTHPDHDTVGRHFEGTCWRCEAGTHVFYCDSYDPRLGFWMTRADCPPERIADERGEWRRNVSERAIGRTFHRIHEGHDGGRPFSAWGTVDPSALTIPMRQGAVS